MATSRRFWASHVSDDKSFVPVSCISLLNAISKMHGYGLSPERLVGWAKTHQCRNVPNFRDSNLEKGFDQLLLFQVRNNSRKNPVNLLEPILDQIDEEYNQMPEPKTHHDRL